MGSSDYPERSNGGTGNGHGGAVVWPPHPNDYSGESETELDITQLLHVLWERRRAIAAIALGVFSLVIVVTLAARMDFRLRSSLYLGDLKGNGGIFDALSAQFGMEKGDVGTEIEIIRSRQLMTEAVLASGLNTTLTPQGWSAPRYWQWRLSGRDLSSLEGAWPEVRAVSTQLTGASGEQREVQIAFKSATEFEVRDGGELLGIGSLGQPLVVPGIELTLVAGSDRAPAPGSRYTLEVTSLEQVLDEVNKRFSAKAPKPLMGSQVNVVHLELTWKSPYYGRMFLEQLMRGYLDLNLSWKTEEAGAAETFLSKQLENIRHSLDKAGQDLAEFKKKESSTIVLSEEAKSMIEQMGTLEQQRVAARLQVEALKQLTTALAKGNVPAEAYLLGEAQDSVLMAMSENLVKAQQEYKRISEQFTPDYPLVREARAALDAQMKSVRTYVNNRLTRAQEQITSLDGAMQRYADKLKELPDAELKLATLTQEADVYSKLYQFLLERQQQAALTKASTILKSRILDPPVIPSREASPRLGLRLALGFGVGLLLGIGFALARWRLATTFQSESEVRKTLPGLALFASIPRGHDNKKRPEGNSVSRPFDTLAADPRSAFAEAFRLLRTNLYYSGSRERDKIVLLSSPGPGDGKTLTTLCLAAILAADGKRVLVVDGDMRKPSHHMLLQQAQHPGLSGILTSETHWRETVHSIQTPFGEFCSISTGIVPPNPAELLSSPNLASFLSEAKKHFDFVLVDSPPFPLVSDALTLAQHADRQLSVIRVGTTRRKVAEEHARRLATVTSRYGIVINDVTAEGGYGYGYGYGYGGELKKKARRSWWGNSKGKRPNPPAATS